MFFKVKTENKTRAKLRKKGVMRMTDDNTDRQGLDKSNLCALRQVAKSLLPRNWHELCLLIVVCVLELKKGFF
jgi:hypothetical protein